MVAEAERMYVEAVEAEFGKGPANKRAVAAILLARERLRTRILDEIGTYLKHELGGDFVTLVQDQQGNLVSRENASSHEALSEKWGKWMLRRREWPANCGLCLEFDSGGHKGIHYGVFAPNPINKEVSDAEFGCPDREKLEKVQDAVSGVGNRNRLYGGSIARLPIGVRSLPLA